MKSDAQRHRGTGAQTLIALLLVLLTGAGGLSAQDDVRGRLEARGLPADLVEQVTAIAAEATAQGLPTDPLAGKAIEGYAKQVPTARIVAAIRDYAGRMADGRAAVRGAGIAAPTREVITAAADAVGRGLQPAQIGQMARAAPQPELLSSGLTVAAALTAQGMPAQRAVAVVTTEMQRGRNSSQILDLPSAARAMQLDGMTPDQAGERMLNGGSGPGRDGSGRGRDGRHGSDEGRGGGGHGSGSGPPPPRPPGTDGRPSSGSGGNSGPGGGDRPGRP